MIYQCAIVDVQPVILAVTEAEVKRSEIPARIRGLFDIVYTWLRESGAAQCGHNYALYDQCTKETLRMRVGFPVSERFTDTELVKCIDLPTGRAAHTTHVGPYNLLSAAYAQLHAWCACESLEQSGLSWELYGDWNDDPSKLVTDIFLRLA